MENVFITGADRGVGFALCEEFAAHGFLMAVDKKDVDTVQSLLKEIHEESYVIGEVTNSGSVDLKW